jgi:hypothetical protein
MRISMLAGIAVMFGASVPAQAAAQAPTAKALQLVCVDSQGGTRTSPLPRAGERCAPQGVPVPAGWTWVASGPGMNIYVHSALGNPPPGLLKVWVLYSFDAPKGSAGKEHLSAKNLEFYSCANGTFAISTSIRFSRPLGEGDAIGSDAFDNPRQMEIPPDTATSWVWKAVCAPGA